MHSNWIKYIWNRDQLSSPPNFLKFPLSFNAWFHLTCKFISILRFGWIWSFLLNGYERRADGLFGVCDVNWMQQMLRTQRPLTYRGSLRYSTALWTKKRGRSKRGDRCSTLDTVSRLITSHLYLLFPLYFFRRPSSSHLLPKSKSFSRH